MKRHSSIKVEFLALMILINYSVTARTYYVSIIGSDHNSGSIEFPWRSFQHANSQVRAGDTVFFRGGTFKIIGSNISFLSGHGGTISEPVCYFNYPGEKPVFDFSDQTSKVSYPTGIRIDNVSYLKFKGFEVRNVTNTAEGGIAFGIYINTSNHVFENITVRNIDGQGFAVIGNNIFFINCDAISCYDSQTKHPGGGGDGWQVNSFGIDNYVYFKGCRAIFCSDDGFDNYWNDGVVIYDSCWALCGGYNLDGIRYSEWSEGNGFKLGRNTLPASGKTQRILRNCLSICNNGAGFTENNLNYPQIKMNIFNNVAYGNRFGFINYSTSEAIEVATYRNNISYKNVVANTKWNSPEKIVQDHNSWNDGIPEVTDSEFLSLDKQQLFLERQENGTLPVVSFFKLSEKSDLIDIGVNVGLPFAGSAPDLGWAETTTSESPILSVPYLKSATIQNISPSKILMTYDQKLAAIVPSASSFCVSVNSTPINVSFVDIQGTNVVINLLSKVYYGDTVTVTYTKPSLNPLQTPNGIMVSSVSTMVVTNMVTRSNSVPVVVAKFSEKSYGGFICEINASDSFDPDNDSLTFYWLQPAGISISSKSGSCVRFLAPVTDEEQIAQFNLLVSDGRITQKQVISIRIIPYKPEIKSVEILNIDASSYYSEDYPYNAIDGIIGTMWSARGKGEFVILELNEIYNLQHIKLSFHPDKKRESQFDVLGSLDLKAWEPILINSISCDFSGNTEVFDFHNSKEGKRYKYVKIVGLGNSSDTWIHISEVKLFGYRIQNILFNNNQIVTIFPNPASNMINIRINEADLYFDFIKIALSSGETVFYTKVNDMSREFQILINLKTGLYLIQMGIGNDTLYAQKIIINN